MTFITDIVVLLLLYHMWASYNDFKKLEAIIVSLTPVNASCISIEPPIGNKDRFSVDIVNHNLAKGFTICDVSVRNCLNFPRVEYYIDSGFYVIPKATVTEAGRTTISFVRCGKWVEEEPTIQLELQLALQRDGYLPGSNIDTVRAVFRV